MLSDALQAVVGIEVSATRARMGTGRDRVFAMPLYRMAAYWAGLGKFAQYNATWLADDGTRKAVPPT